MWGRCGAFYVRFHSAKHKKTRNHQHEKIYAQINIVNCGIVLINKKCLNNVEKNVDKLSSHEEKMRPGYTSQKKYQDSIPTAPQDR